MQTSLPNPPEKERPFPLIEDYEDTPSFTF